MTETRSSAVLALGGPTLASWLGVSLVDTPAGPLIEILGATPGRSAERPE